MWRYRQLAGLLPPSEDSIHYPTVPTTGSRRNVFFVQVHSDAVKAQTLNAESLDALQHRGFAAIVAIGLAPS